MSYIIMSGRYETGTAEQQQGFAMLLGADNIQYKFDLYFHWYNLVHEMGHCIKSGTEAQMSDLREEMYVNELAVAYYRQLGEDARLSELESMIANAVGSMPSPVPDGQDFEDFYESIWGTEQLMNVMVYGYLQLNSVLMALRGNRTLADVLDDIGISIDTSKALAHCDLPITSESADTFLRTARENMIALGVDVPEIRLELQDNPGIQCARYGK
ncbi:MAG: hypothetical protein J5752_11885 [Clostridiales bacterium]|nr:hypothetical protein [Clostridiales bacterium]